jgi:hypothetical protein
MNDCQLCLDLPRFPLYKFLYTFFVLSTQSPKLCSPRCYLNCHNFGAVCTLLLHHFNSPFLLLDIFNILYHTPFYFRLVVSDPCEATKDFFFCGVSTRLRVTTSAYGASRSPIPITPYSVGLLWTSDQPDAETLMSQQTDVHAPGGIQTRNPSKRAAADPRLRPRGHCRDRTKHYTLHVLILW